jgi:hypothetical protein
MKPYYLCSILKKCKKLLEKISQVSFQYCVLQIFVSNFWHCNCNLAYKVQSVTTRQEIQKDNDMK